MIKNKLLRKYLIEKIKPRGQFRVVYDFDCIHPDCMNIIQLQSQRYNSYTKVKREIFMGCCRKCSQSDIVKTMRGIVNPFRTKEGQQRAKDAVKKKYGVDNVFQSEEIKTKIKKTLLEKYGVDSPQKSKEIKQKTRTTNIDRYGTAVFCNSEEGKKISRKTCLEKFGTEFYFQSQQFFDDISLEGFIRRYGAILGEKKYKELKDSKIKNLLLGNTVSKLEKRVVECIDYEIKTQFAIKNPKNNRYFLYDVQYKNKIVEINGDYWHANPHIYSMMDILSFPGKRKFAIEVWAKDEEKLHVAEAEGFEIMVVWENEIKKNFTDVIKNINLFLKGD